MSATAALEKWLELKKNSALPILSTQPILGELKSQNADLNLVSEKILNVLIFSLVYILILILVGFVNWLSRYLYFKAKRPNSTLVHSLYYTLLYPSGIGKIYYKYEIRFLYIFTALFHSVQYSLCLFSYLYLYCTCTVLILILYLYLNCICINSILVLECTFTILVLVLYYLCTRTVLVLYLYLYCTVSFRSRRHVHLIPEQGP